MRTGKLVAMMTVLLCASFALAQSLGDVARQQREQKKAKAARVVTNDQIPPKAEAVSEPLPPAEQAKIDAKLQDLKSEDKAKRTAALLSLWQKSQEKPVDLKALQPFVLGLADAALDRDLNIRYMAASTLKNVAEVADPAIPALIQALDTFPGGDPPLEGPPRYFIDARSVAAEALGAIGPAAKESIPALTKALKDPAPPVREAAAAALKLIQEE